MNIVIQITDEEYKVLEWQVMSPEQWIIDAVRGKITKSTKRMLLELSDKRYETMSKEEIKTLIQNSTLKTRVEKEV